MLWLAQTKYLYDMTLL